MRASCLGVTIILLPVKASLAAHPFIFNHVNRWTIVNWRKLADLRSSAQVSIAKEVFCYVTTWRLIFIICFWSRNINFAFISTQLYCISNKTKSVWHNLHSHEARGINSRKFNVHVHNINANSMRFFENRSLKYSYRKLRESVPIFTKIYIHST